MDDKLLTRFRALFDLANHPNTPESERRLAQERVEHMMLKHSITEAMAFEGHTDRIKAYAMDIDIKGVHSTSRGILLHQVAAIFGCKVIRTRDIYGKLSNRYSIYGMDQDIDLSFALFDHLDMQMRGEYQRLGIVGSTPVKSFVIGYTHQVSDRLRKLYKKVKCEVSSEKGVGTDLVLQERDDAVDALMRQEHPHLITRRRRAKVDLVSSLLGAESGEKADIFLPGARFDGTDDTKAVTA